MLLYVSDKNPDLAPHDLRLIEGRDNWRWRSSSRGEDLLRPFEVAGNQQPLGHPASIIDSRDDRSIESQPAHSLWNGVEQLRHRRAVLQPRQRNAGRTRGFRPPANGCRVHDVVEPANPRQELNEVSTVYDGGRSPFTPTQCSENCVPCSVKGSVRPSEVGYLVCRKGRISH